jgi:putative AlgH/UPF0301 family transcriptional regulator
MQILLLLVVHLPIFQSFTSPIYTSLSFRKFESLESKSQPRNVREPHRIVLFESKTTSEASDWKDFRAKLVLGNRGIKESSTSFDSSLSPASWAYDTGTFVEPGSILVSRVTSTVACHDLRQPYLHKCVILILEHSDNDFTKGIILNRPTNITLNNTDIEYSDDKGDEDIEFDDDDEILTIQGIPEFKEELISISNSTPNDLPPFTWQNILFGGEIGGFLDDDTFDDIEGLPEPSLLVLHSIETSLAHSVSSTILKNLCITTHSGALVIKSDLSDALGEFHQSEDSMMLVYGLMVWEPGQLQKEIQEDTLWHALAVDSESIQNQLRQQQDSLRTQNDPNAVIETMWLNLMNMVGKDTSLETNIFADKMLRAWTQDYLLSLPEDDSYVDDAMIFRALGAAQGPTIKEGTLVRASSLIPSPFLLNCQLLHKSVVLVYQDDDNLSVGLILNHPTKDEIVLDISSKKCNSKIAFPIRYGGWMGHSDDDDLIWLHNNPAMQKAGLGSPLGLQIEEGSFFWTCSIEDVQDALKRKIASVEDFLVIQGFCVWEKEAGAGGIAGQVLAGNFETVIPETLGGIWHCLQKQKVLSDDTLDHNLKLSALAWNMEQQLKMEANDTQNKQSHSLLDDDASNNLAEEALRHWMEIFLLDGQEYEPL